MNVTFKADEPLVRKARIRAKTENRSLNDVFIDWLKVYAGQNGPVKYEDIMKKFSHIKAGRKFTRDEMNER